MDGVDTEVLFSDLNLHLRRKNVDVPDIYFTLLDAAGIQPSVVLKRIAKLKIEDAESLSKYVRQKLKRLYTQGAAAFGSVRNLVKASRLPV